MTTIKLLKLSRVFIGCTALRQQDFYLGLKVEQENQTLNEKAEHSISMERTSEQSNPLCAVFFFNYYYIGCLGRIDA